MAVVDRLSCECPRVGNASRRAGAYVVSRSAYLPACTLGTHTHPEDRVVLTAHGRFDSTYGSRAFTLDAHRTIFRPAHVEHRDRYDRETACITIRLPAGELPLSQPFDLVDDELPSAARRLWAELSSHDSASELALESLTAEILGRLTSRPDRAGAAPRWIRSIRDRIEDEFADPPALCTLAREAGRDPAHVATTFRRAYGKSIGALVRDIRIWRTRRLLEDPAIPLAEVAACGGFADQSHFTRLFKCRFAMTPGQYRRRTAPPA
jgi:AraC family transcriptional regulator